MTARTLSLSLVLALLACGAILFFPSEKSITFRSIESKTIHGSDVYNQVKLETYSKQDIWRMRQSHGGKDLPMSEWDELAIKVDKSKRPYLVSYHQLKNGKETEYKVSCFFCHSNGPRAIRTDSPLPLFEKSIITFWNLRIKTYGRMQIKKNSNLINNQKRLIPLQYFGKKDLEPLTIRSCTLCHNESWWSRGQLTRQQDLTIRHLVSSGKMPPWPLSLGVEEKKKLELFLQGF